MTTSWRFEAGPVHLVRLATGDDLYTAISEFVRGRDISCASLEYLGAVRSAALRYYDQGEQEYRDFTIDQHLEVMAGIGNVTTLDGRPFVHTHAVFGDAEGRAFGGHVNVGCEVFAMEVTVTELIGDPPVRLHDDCTGLTLWGGTPLDGC